MNRWIKGVNFAVRGVCEKHRMRYEGRSSHLREGECFLLNPPAIWPGGFYCSPWNRDARVPWGASAAKIGQKIYIPVNPENRVTIICNPLTLNILVICGRKWDCNGQKGCDPGVYLDTIRGKERGCSTSRGCPPHVIWLEVGILVSLGTKLYIQFFSNNLSQRKETN